MTRELGRLFLSTGASRIWQINLWRFDNFMHNLMEWLDINRPGWSFLFTIDNLNLHRHPVTTKLIYACGHCVVFWAPYWSCDGAIEYIYNTLQTHLQIEINGVDTVFCLANEINFIIGGVPSFKR
jgi:hypothetical protein